MLNGGIYLTFFGEYLIGCLFVRLTVTLPTYVLAGHSEMSGGIRMHYLVACDNSFSGLLFWPVRPRSERVISAGQEPVARF